MLMAVLPMRLITLLPEYIQTNIWVRIHGLVQNKRRFPRVLREFVIYQVVENHFKWSSEPSSILEFGCSTGALTRNTLHFVEVAGGKDADVVYYAFDTFEGLPEGDEKTDFRFESVESKRGPNWVAGSFAASYQTLDDSLKSAGYSNYRLVKGLFSESLTDQVLDEIRKRPPFLVIVDCDFYTSTRDIFEKLLPVLKNGTVFYFDDTHLNYYSSQTGELKAIRELNEGAFGEGYELVEAHELGILGRRFFRFVSIQGNLSEGAEGEDVQAWTLASNSDTPMALGIEGEPRLDPS